MAREGCRIAVIGAGFSGVMTAIHLLWRCKPGERVYLVERGDRVGPGLAYGTHNPRHLVNVRAENMSAFADEPDHFVRWLERLEPERRAEAGRAHHRRHLRAPLGVRRLRPGAAARGDRAPGRGRQSLPGRPTRRPRSAEPTAASSWRPATAASTRSTPPSWRWATWSSRRTSCPGYVANPWSRGGDRTARAGPAGGRARHRADHGRRLPGAHRAGLRGADPRHLAPRPAAARPRALHALGRACGSRAARSALAAGAVPRGPPRGAPGRRSSAVGWRAVIDAVRPHAQTLWAELAPADKARFVRHVRPWWDIHRHRMAPPVAATLATPARLRHRCTTHAGRIASIEPAGTARCGCAGAPRVRRSSSSSWPSG